MKTLRNDDDRCSTFSSIDIHCDSCSSNTPEHPSPKYYDTKSRVSPCHSSQASRENYKNPRARVKTSPSSSFKKMFPVIPRPSFFSVNFLVLCVLSSCQATTDEVPTPIGKCDAGRMTVTIPTHAIPFKGIIHARGFRSNDACFANSSSTSFAPPSLTLNMLALPGDSDYCGVISLKDGREKAVSIAIRAHSSLELQEDKYFLLTCSNIKTASKGQRTSKALRDREQEGLLFYDLEAGHSTRPVAILGKSYYFGPKEINHIIGSCVAFGSTPDSTSVVELLDNKGCPSDAAIVNSVEFMTRDTESSEPDAEVLKGGRIMKVKIKSMFRFPNKDFKKEESTKDVKRKTSSNEDSKFVDNRVTIQCTSVPCGGSKCPAPCTREAGQLLSDASSTTSLVSTSVNVLDPGMECDHELQHELTRDWLIALLVCLGILLLVMFCVNLFMCSSMACTCYKQEIIDTSSVNEDEYSNGPVNSAYDYDPYKNSHQIPDHPLYASLSRPKPHSMIEAPSSGRHPHLGSPHQYDIHRETYSVGADHGRSRSRHSNYY